MRQTNAGILQCNNMISRVMLCILLLFFSGSGPLLADITGVLLAVTSSGGDTKINGSGLVTLTANWTGDTPPYSAAFKSGGNTLGTEATTGNTATFQVSGAVLGHGSKSFEVTVIETSVPNANEGTANGDKAIEVDLIAPQLTVTLNGSTFSNNPGNNEIIIQVTSDEVISAPTITVSPNTLGSSPTADPTNPTAGQSFRYTIQLTSAPGGNYTLTATGRDVTEPAAGANTGTTSAMFSVNAAGPGAGAITAVDPGTPTNANSITLSGTAAATMDSGRQVEILEGGTVVATGNISGGNWSASINSIAEGEHVYTMRGYDNLGNISAESAPFTVKVDRTAPSTPTLNQPSSPTGLANITITGTGAKDQGTLTSLPVNVTVYNMDGNAIASSTAGSDGSFNIAGVPLVDGMNQFYVMAADSTVPNGGNKSGLSNRVTVIKDNTATTVAGVFISRAPYMASYSVPLDPNYQLGAGSYQVQARFEEEMDTTQNPTITVQTANGSTLANSAGNWVASDSFVGSIIIPKNGGDDYDGVAGLRVSGAKDLAGNTSTDYNEAAAFTIDSTPPVSTFDVDDAIYISSSTASISLGGEVTDSGSGIEYVDLVWQPFNGGAVASKTVPIQASSPSPWSYNWTDAAGLAAGRYKLWVIAGDRAKPAANVESYQTKDYRIVIVDKNTPVVSKISIGNLPQDINAMNGGAPPVIASAVTKLTAVITDMGNSGIDFNHSAFEFTLQHDDSASVVLGNLTNNGSTTAFFDFPELTRNGTYTVTVIPVDMAGNVGETATRAFIIDKTGPVAGEFYPANHRIANETQVAIAQDQVWATIAEPDTDYSSSTIEVRYNGNIVGEQIPGASATALVWDLYGPTTNMPLNQSADGRYDITVVPSDIYGNEGSVIRSYFYFDCVPPVIKSFEPQANLGVASPSWFGLDLTEISITVSDAPKDIITYKDNMTTGNTGGFDFSTVQIPQDPNWYNSNGSGINTTTSSYTVTIDGVDSGPAAVYGDKFYHGRPAIPENTEPGVADVAVQFNIQDMVNDGEIIPNFTTGSYTLKFDYLAPQAPVINKPSANDKYCKNSVLIEGTAQDNGSSTELAIKSIEWSEKGSTFKAFSVAGLPAAMANFVTSFDITDRDDGTYVLDIRSVDLGDNRSSTTPATFMVDRTPPEPPELVVPLPDGITNKRGQLFKWAASTDADRYLLQIADDSSFNNILNKQDNTGYQELVGQVTIMTESSFSVPKDGTYYWRVAAIETCVDGYNISSFSATRKFSVDSVKPVVVEVQPAPSSGNKITTGMVTFTIRFSELLDTTVVPSVRLTSNGGQVMKVEMTNFREDTWIGTTVIPNNDSSVYDGTAIISIQGASDLAGNLMADDSSNSVVINTGPAFTTKIFSNPANVFEIMIVTKASEALQSPPSVSVQQSSKKTPVTMNFLKERYYAGSYIIDTESPGKAYIDVSGTDLHGMTGHASVEFMVAELSEDTRLNITSGMANLKAAESSAFVKSSIYMFDREHLDSPFRSEIRGNMMPEMTQVARNGSELLPLMALEEIGPANLKLKKRLLYSTDIKNLRTKIPYDKIGIYKLGNNGYWLYQGSEIKDNMISAQLSGLGRLAIMADMTAPSIKDQYPADMDELEDSMPEISGQLLDYGSGVKKDSMRLFIDDMQVPQLTLNSDGTFKYKVKIPMKKGKHQIRVEAEDLAGNELRNSFWVTTLGPFAIDEFMPYPNPATGNHIYFNYNFNQTAERVQLKIYDVSGDRVTTHDTFDFASTKQGRFRWDLRNDNGRMVSNGVYFYKLEITKNGRTFKKRGKFAVMR